MNTVGSTQDQPQRSYVLSPLCRIEVKYETVGMSEKGSIDKRLSLPTSIHKTKIKEHIQVTTRGSLISYARAYRGRHVGKK